MQCCLYSVVKTGKIKLFKLVKLCVYVVVCSLYAPCRMDIGLCLRRVGFSLHSTKDTYFNNNLSVLTLYNQHCITTENTDDITIISSGFNNVDKQLLYILSVFFETP